MTKCYYNPKNYYDPCVVNGHEDFNYYIGLSNVGIAASIVGMAITKSYTAYFHDEKDFFMAMSYGVKEGIHAASGFVMLVVVPSLFSADPVYSVEYSIDATRYFYDTLVCEEPPLVSDSIYE